MHRVRLHRVFEFTATAALFLAGPLAAQEVPVTQGEADTVQVAGEYFHSEMEMVAGIRLDADGTFLYGLTVGSLDERGQGRWTASGNRIELVSDPRPVAPAITPGDVEAASGQPFALRLLGPNGSDVPGVDLLIEFAEGEPLVSYTDGGAWTLPADETRTPKFVTFSKLSYRINSGRLPLAAKPGTVANFILTPNDLGMVDFTGAVAELDGDTLTLHRPDGGTMTFERRGD